MEENVGKTNTEKGFCFAFFGDTTFTLTDEWVELSEYIAENNNVQHVPDDSAVSIDRFYINKISFNTLSIVCYEMQRMLQPNRGLPSQAILQSIYASLVSNFKTSPGIDGDSFKHTSTTIQGRPAIKMEYTLYRDYMELPQLKYYFINKTSSAFFEVTVGGYLKHPIQPEQIKTIIYNYQTGVNLNELCTKAVVNGNSIFKETFLNAVERLIPILNENTELLKRVVNTYGFNLKQEHLDDFNANYESVISGCLYRDVYGLYEDASAQLTIPEEFAIKRVKLQYNLEKWNDMLRQYVDV